MKKILITCALALAALLTPSTASAQTKGEKAAEVIGNIVSSVTGNVMTTESNLKGTWTYNEPCVQFESENMLKAAGGAAAATKFETKIATIYRMAGLEAGKASITFDKDQKFSFTVNGRTLEGKYTFDKSNKTVTLTSVDGKLNLKAYVTVTVSQMSLCFDSTKVLDLVGSVCSQASNISSTAAAISALSANYKGMKTGFKFKK